MAALDRELARGQRWSNCLDDLCRLVPKPGRRERWRPREPDTEYPGEQPAPV
jgi:hypothetical protein